MGRAQVMQAEAAGIEPSVRHEPHPAKTHQRHRLSGDRQRRSPGKYDARREYYAMKKRSLIPQILEAYDKLAAQYDVDRAGRGGKPGGNQPEGRMTSSIWGMARLVDAPVLLVGDIDRGGVFASLAGTLMLLEDGGTCDGQRDL